MGHLKTHMQTVSAGLGEHALFMVFSLNDGKDAEEKAKKLSSKFLGCLRALEIDLQI